MTQVTKTIYLFAALNEYDSAGACYYFTSLDPKTPLGYILVGQATISHDEPSRGDLIAAKIGKYQDEIRQARVDAELVAREKGEAIQNLLAISYEERTT